MPCFSLAAMMPTCGANFVIKRLTAKTSYMQAHYKQETYVHSHPFIPSKQIGNTVLEMCFANRDDF
jgi:hypothetical protein